MVRKNNFRHYEEKPSSLGKIARESSRKAIRESKAVGLSITYLKNGEIFQETPDGKVQKIGALPKKTTRKIVKGQKLYAKKN